jgi:hypothetical protein
MKIQRRILPILGISIFVMAGCAPAHRERVVVRTAPAVVEPAPVIVAEPPPPPTTEVITVSPGPEYVWIQGYWGWRGNRWVWERGHWERPPRAHAVWVPGHYYVRDNHHHWVPGHWR